MGRRKKQAPVWLQLLIVWIVVSGLGASGLMFLRARDVVSDAVFQPLAPLLCGAGARIDTAYSSRMSLVDNRGRSTPVAGRQQVSTGLDRATCVWPDREGVAVTGGFTAVVLALGGVAGAVVVAGMMALRRR